MMMMLRWGSWGRGGRSAGRKMRGLLNRVCEEVGGNRWRLSRLLALGGGGLREASDELEHEHELERDVR